LAHLSRNFMDLVMRVGRRLSSKIDNPRKERTDSSKTGKEFSSCFGHIVDPNTACADRGGGAPPPSVLAPVSDES
jgi:hypothetical protein